jgi:hypothetical protein
MTASDELRELLDRIYDSFNSGDASVRRDDVSEDVIGIGSDPDEWWEGRETVIRVAQAQVEAMSAAGVRVSGGEPFIAAEGGVVWAAVRPTFWRSATSTFPSASATRRLSVRSCRRA